MSDYALHYSVPYEGRTEILMETAEAVVAWVKRNPVSYDYSYDNLTLIGPTGEMDLFELMRRAEAGLTLVVESEAPAADPDHAQAAAAMRDVLSAFAMGRVDADTLATIDELRALVVRKIEEAEAHVEAGGRPFGPSPR